MIESAKSAYSQYFSISGRASRYEFWSFMLYQFVGLILIGCICVLASYVFDDKRGLSFTLGIVVFFSSYSKLHYSCASFA